ncbi:MAG: YggS family pyridoxal phosphate-dependent enzyme [Gammaproteobacteria bacterium]|nr:YggS family pyridoxal phosphate-dependent enzyme [Gammaproteobacteria bacterium]
MKSITSNIDVIQSQIAATCLACGRDPSDVTLLAVSKTQPIQAIAEAIQAGLTAFGENQAQEALPKIQYFAAQSPEWHFIGPLQRNKTKLVAQHFSWVHSVDRLLLAQRLSEQRPEHLPPLNVCIQVNVDQEPQKHGVTLDELPALATAIARLPRLRLRGLMTIPKATTDQAQQRHCFAALRQAQEQLSLPLDTLSMGMSNDFAAAIAEGATIIRVGTAIFGTRPRAN